MDLFAQGRGLTVSTIERPGQPSRPPPTEELRRSTLTTVLRSRLAALPIVVPISLLAISGKLAAISMTCCQLTNVDGGYRSSKVLLCVML